MKKSVYIFVFILALVSCRTYNDKLTNYHAELGNNQFTDAEKTIRNLKFLNHKRNEILRCLELGKVLHNQHQFDSSNVYLNKADELISHRHTLRNTSTSLIINEAMTYYQGEDFEKILVHYYKALNYLFLQKNEDALVEAKQINIQLSQLGDKQFWDGKKYKADAFAHTLQGIIYEKMNDYNNAFIAYRNAVELYQDNAQLEYLGITLPLQLKKDLINTANKAGFYTERDEYCQKFALNFDSIKSTTSNELLVFWENGLAPIKKQKEIDLFLIKGVGGVLSYADKTGNINIPFPLPPEDVKDAKLSDFGILRLVYPIYESHVPYFQQMTIADNSKQYVLQSIENIDFIAHKTLQEQLVKNLTFMASRVLLKKIAEYKVRKENEGLGAVLGIIGAASEKADTRNWNSLPSMISYVRIPVNKGDNTLPIKYNTINNTSVTDTIYYQAKSTLGIINISSLKHI